jgi:hypothetical protein
MSTIDLGDILLFHIYKINNSYLKSLLKQNMLYRETIPFDFDDDRNQFVCFHVKTYKDTCSRTNRHKYIDLLLLWE